ncbi:MAG: 5-formyltetrahydrofolate cyclo-ligase [Planctomycetota bacterium]|nr:5-formyltetrahydrofolate cyclo-ligase [Planctomycetota bacterium]
MDASHTPHDITDRKNAIRSDMRTRLATLTAAQRAEWSTAACARLIRSVAFARASRVMLYMPMRSEVDVISVALEAFRLGKSVCVPRVDGSRKNMNAVETTSFDDESMDSDSLGVRAPKVGQEIPHEEIDLVIVPGVAFDMHGFRLGRGGGYYDRYLARFSRGTATIGVCFDIQFVEEIPTEPTDIAVHAVVSDRRAVQRDPSLALLAVQDRNHI